MFSAVDSKTPRRSRKNIRQAETCEICVCILKRHKRFLIFIPFSDMLLN